MIMYAIRNNQIVTVKKIIKENKRGTGVWAKIKSSKNPVLISYSKLYIDYEKAQKYLEEKTRKKK